HLALLDLHSFPTRRSSDLSKTPPFAGPVSLPHPSTVVTLFLRMRNSRPLACLVTILFLRCWMACQFNLGWLMPSIPNSLACLRRSEEHTSELQSPYDLVCR